MLKIQAQLAPGQFTLAPATFHPAADRLPSSIRLPPLGADVVPPNGHAGRAARILARDSVIAGGRVARVEPDRCVACLPCVRSCPFGAVRIDPELTGVGGIQGAARVEAAL